MPDNRSAFKDFIASISTISGDLSNITAPPFVLAENSTVELPQYWADHPQLFVAPANESDPAKRALLVLKWFLGSLRNQQYAGRSEDDGVKKPLNAFLGELFRASFPSEQIGETKLLSEQVSHHPPVTACYLWNDKCGVRAEGFTCQEITFNGSVSIKQKGFAILHVDAYDEDYLIPLPYVKVKGVLTGSPYPELEGTVRLGSSSGYVSEISFEGKGFLHGTKNGVDAKLWHVDRPTDVLYSVNGQWNGELTIREERAKNDLERYNVTTENTAKISIAPLDDQDPWESRRAWKDVIASLQSGNMQGVSDAKSKVEQGQRKMREDEKKSGGLWNSVFFTKTDALPIFDKLSKICETGTTIDKEGGMWKIDRDAVERVKRPYHGDLAPDNSRATNAPRQEEDRTENESGAPTQSSYPSANSGGMDTQRNGTEARTNGEPSDAQVETFLRDKYSAES